MSGFGSRTPATFHDTVAPAGYVPGRGRGSYGFTTRSDFGTSAPARPAVSVNRVDSQFGAAPAGYVAGRGRAMGALAREQGEGGAEATPTPTVGSGVDGAYDQFSGYSAPLFKQEGFDKEDDEADLVYKAIDDKMSRKKRKKDDEDMLLTTTGINGTTGPDPKRPAFAEPPKETPKGQVTTRFSDLKDKLNSVTPAEWDMIPEAGDGSLKYKQARQAERYQPMSDGLLSGGPVGGGNSALEAAAAAAPSSSLATGMATARGSVLGSKLDKMGDDVSGQTVVDPKGYLTDLSSVQVNSNAEIGDIKKARALLESVTTTNPSHGPGWVAAARLEEYAGRLPQARKIIRRGVEVCPLVEDVWLEAMRLSKTDNAKVIAAQAIKHLPKSVKLWLAAAGLESLASQKKLVLRRALEFVPRSLAVWKAAIELENAEDARIMLARAVECIPAAGDLWIGLAKLESYENARKVLNKARAANPTDHRIWLTAAKLEEAHGKTDVTDKIVARAVTSLEQLQVSLDRTAWLKEAQMAEQEGHIATGAAIVRATLAKGVEEQDYERTWLDDAEACLDTSTPFVATARAVLNYALSIKQLHDSLYAWMALVELERKHGTGAAVIEVLQRAVRACPDVDVLWLMAAKEMWKSGDVTEARAVLNNAIDSNPGSERVLLAGVKFEQENGEFTNARKLAERARKEAPSGRVWMKSAQLERSVGNFDAALRTVDDGLARYATEAKLHLMGIQLCIGPLNRPEEGRQRFKAAVEACPESHILWVLFVQLEQRLHGAAKARSVLDMGRAKLPTNEYIWREAARLERRAAADKDAKQGAQVADSVLSVALQKAPTSAVLWAEYVMHAPKPAQKQRSVDALKKCDASAEVITAVACLFLKDGKLDKARKWLTRAVTLNPDAGDSWMALYAVEMEAERTGLGPAEEGKEEVMKRCVAADPKHGERWTALVKGPQTRGEKAPDPREVLVRGAALLLREL